MNNKSVRKDVRKNIADKIQKLLKIMEKNEVINCEIVLTCKDGKIERHSLIG